jgi:hypothetical protein
MRLCIICLRPTKRSQFCRLCCRSYDRYSFEDASVCGAIEWAAKRARRFEKARRNG